MQTPGLPRRLLRAILRDEDNVNLIDSTPLAFMHLAALVGLFLVPFAWAALAVAAILYVVRVFALTAGYHRYFSHRAFRTSRAFQFLLAFVGGTSAQLGPLWWAAHHRHHHRFADTEQDIHSPAWRGLFWSHLGWLLCRKYSRTELDLVPDLAKFPELRFLDRWHALPPLMLLVSLFGLGEWAATARPGWGLTGGNLVVYGFFLSTVLVYHATFCINSLTHVIGRRRFATADESRNSLLLALITMGEGWHNNHHRYPVATRQGFYWWEIDLTYGILRALSWVGLVWDLRPVPAKIYEEARQAAPGQEAEPADAGPVTLPLGSAPESA